MFHHFCAADPPGDGVAARLEPLAAQPHLTQLDLSANFRKRMVPWPTALTQGDLGPALVAVVIAAVVSAAVHVRSPPSAPIDMLAIATLVVASTT